MRISISLMMALVLMFISASAYDKATSKDESKKDGTTQKQEYMKRKKSNPEIAIETDFGTMKLEMYRDVAPAHVDSMLARVREKFYDSQLFYRIIDGFMIQAGDPSMRGGGNAGYNLDAEFSKLKHVEGTLSMARGQLPNSASSQFFICLAPQPHLDGKYSIFGHLMEGYDVLHKIGSLKINPSKNNRPLKDVYIRKMFIIKDITEDESK